MTFYMTDEELFPNPIHLKAFNEHYGSALQVILRAAKRVVNSLADRVSIDEDGGVSVRANLELAQVEAIAMIARFQNDSYRIQCVDGGPLV